MVTLSPQILYLPKRISGCAPGGGAGARPVKYAPEQIEYSFYTHSVIQYRPNYSQMNDIATAVIDIGKDIIMNYGISVSVSALTAVLYARHSISNQSSMDRSHVNRQVTPPQTSSYARFYLFYRTCLYTCI